VTLLRARRSERVRPVDYFIVLAAAVGFLVALALPIALAAWLATWVFQTLGNSFGT
jgi:hypothetical protein